VGNCQDSTQLKQFLADRLGAASTETASSLQPLVTYKTAVSPPTDMAAPGVVGGSVTLKLTFQTIDLNFPFIPVPNDGKVTREIFGRVEDTTSLTDGCV
jgi:hypothetical protein